MFQKFKWRGTKIFVCLGNIFLFEELSQMSCGMEEVLFCHPQLYLLLTVFLIFFLSAYFLSSAIDVLGYSLLCANGIRDGGPSNVEMVFKIKKKKKRRNMQMINLLLIGKLLDVCRLLQPKPLFKQSIFFPVLI